MSRISLITFSDASMECSRRLCAESAKRHGVDNVIQCVATDNLTERGLGFWKWKPRIIHNLLSGEDSFVRLNDDSYLIYADAGIEFINNVRYIIDRMDQDVWLFSNMYSHSHWCKGDAMRSVFPDGKWEDFGKQVQASVILFKVSDFSRAFVKEWLELCLVPGLIDDSPSQTPNHEEFREHRHDQSLLTCLAYKYNVSLHWWPAVYNQFVPGGPVFTYEKGEYVDTYPPLFHHHRLRNSEWPAIPNRSE